jgi:hypothetical protein
MLAEAGGTARRCRAALDSDDDDADDDDEDRDDETDEEPAVVRDE